MSDAHRLRSGRACSGCRKRKSRCDGARPQCSYCAKRNFECIYASPSRREGYVASLEGKVRRLERELRRQTPSSISPPSCNGNLGAHLEARLEAPLIVSMDVTEEEEEEEVEYDSDGEWQAQPRSLDVVDHGMSCHAPSTLIPYTVTTTHLSMCSSRSSIRPDRRFRLRVFAPRDL